MDHMDIADVFELIGIEQDEVGTAAFGDDARIFQCKMACRRR